MIGVLLAPAMDPQRTTNSGLLMKCMNLLARASSGSLVVVPLLKMTVDAAAIRIVVLILIRPRIRIVTRHFILTQLFFLPKWICAEFIQKDEYTPNSSTMSLLQHYINMSSNVGESWKERDTLAWILSKVDSKKLMDRICIAQKNPDVATKLVLLEYTYTTKLSVAAGAPNLLDRLENGTIVHDAMYRKEFVELMNSTFAVKDKVEWYRRRKVDRDGNRDVHRMQLVLKFLPGAFAESLPPPIVGILIDVPPPPTVADDGLLGTLIAESDIPIEHPVILIDDPNRLAFDNGC